MNPNTSRTRPRKLCLNFSYRVANLRNYFALGKIRSTRFRSLYIPFVSSSQGHGCLRFDLLGA